MLKRVRWLGKVRKFSTPPQILVGVYIFLLVCLTIYSYALIDPNLTLVQNQAWVNFRNAMVQFGYYERELSWNIYLVLVIILFFVHFLMIKSDKLNPVNLALITGIILLLGYPFLSHDLFNYIFDAKIFTFYHDNPYSKTALDYQNDHWLRFMHWTHRTYPYGPSFLLITLVPSFLALGKFILNYVLFRALFIASYILSIWLINRRNRRLALLFATHPFILIEGLINSHNEILAVAFALLALHLAENNKILGYFTGLISIGIKYMSLPILLILYNQKYKKLALALQIIILGYACFKLGLQQWYFLNLFIFIILFPNLINNLALMFLGSLLSYYPYIALGGWEKIGNWDTPDKIMLKNNIFVVFLVLNLALLTWQRWKKHRTFPNLPL